MLNELRLVFLLAAVWASEVVCKRLNVSPIIGQILAGLVVGPALLDVIPYVDALRLLGKLGIMVLVVEAGLTVNLEEIRRFGVRASLAAATGVMAPTLLSFVLYSGALGIDWKTTLAVGAAISPTSLGFSAQMLAEVGELASPIGQLICTTAVMDDVMSLLLLAEVLALGEDDSKWYAYALPVVGSVCSVLLGSLATLLISSRTRPLNAWLVSLNRASRAALMTKSSPAGRTANTCINHEIEIEFSPNKRGRNPAEEMETARLRLGGGPEREEAEAESRAIDQAEAGIPGERMGAMCLGDRVLFAMVLALALLFAYLSALVGSSDLLGCFFGGLAFSSVPGVRSVWERQMKRYTRWGSRLFFSATVAFSVPSIYAGGGLFRPTSFLKGLVLTAAAVVGKLVVGFYSGPPYTLSGFLKLGWAMNGRGEFSFFIAQQASDQGILRAEDYSAVIWALLLSSIAATIAFRRVLAADRRGDGGTAGDDFVDFGVGVDAADVGVPSINGTKSADGGGTADDVAPMG